MKIISKSLCTSKIVLVNKLFLCTFCENILISFIIMLEGRSWLSKSIAFWFSEVLDISWNTIPY